MVFTFTFTTSLNVAVAPAASEPALQLAVPVAPTGGALQLNTVPLVWASETKTVFAGIWSLTQAPWAPLGPALAIVRVYVRLAPAMTGSGSSAWVMKRSASVLTWVFPVSELLFGFGSFVELATVTVS